jgi:type III secretion protein V
MTIEAQTQYSNANVIGARISAWLSNLGGRWDIVLGVILLVGVGIMLIPLPTFVVDTLISINIAITLLVLLVAFYIKSPLQFLSFPAVILLATMLRLALTISTTRLILLNGDAGEIIKTFGSFVVAGSVAVGLIIFILITIVQFIVVTKGAERIAEVAARFSLNALPGRQMAIDADLRAGDIDKEQAREMRRQLARKSQFNGAMDGAMKFVKGDAIAAMIIVAVNLIGGISIGMVARDMDFATATETYALLTIGDGLISQIPSLLIAIAAGAVVSRVASDADGGSSVGNDIAGQLSAQAVPIFMAASALAVIGLLPGFPTAILWPMAAVLALMGWLAFRRSKTDNPTDTSTRANLGDRSTEQQDAEVSNSGDVGQSNSRAVPEVGPQDVLSLALGSDLRTGFDWQELSTVLEAESRKLAEDLGITLGNVGLSAKNIPAPDGWQILADGAVSASGNMATDTIATDADERILSALQIMPIGRFALPDGGQWAVVNTEDADRITDAGAIVLSLVAVIGRGLCTSAERLAPSLIGIQETAMFLKEAEATLPDLVSEVRGRVSLQRLTDVLRQLLEDGVSLAHRRLILEGVSRHSDRASDPTMLAEHVRSTLSRPISQAAAGPDGAIPALILRDDLEQMFRYASPAAGRSWLGAAELPALPKLLASLRSAFNAAPLDTSPVLICSPDIRRKVQMTLLAAGVTQNVLSTADVNADFPLKPLGTLGY